MFSDKRPVGIMFQQSLGIGGAERYGIDIVNATSKEIKWVMLSRFGGIHKHSVKPELIVGEIDILEAVEIIKPDFIVNNIDSRLLGLTKEIACKKFMIAHSPHPWTSQFFANDTYDGVFYPGVHQKEYFEKLAPALHIPSYVNIKKRTLNFNTGYFVIGYVGRADADKGVLLLPKLAKALKEKTGKKVKLSFVGLVEKNQKERTGAWNHVYELLLAELEVNQVPYEIHECTENIEQYYSSFNVTALLSNHEGAPYVPLESLSCGTPVVAFNVGDLYTYLTPETGSIITSRENYLHDFISVIDRPANEVSLCAANAIECIQSTRSKDQWLLETMPKLIERLTN